MNKIPGALLWEFDRQKKGCNINTNSSVAYYSHRNRSGAFRIFLSMWPRQVSTFKDTRLLYVLTDVGRENKLVSQSKEENPSGVLRCTSACSGPGRNKNTVRSILRGNTEVKLHGDVSPGIMFNCIVVNFIISVSTIIFLFVILALKSTQSDVGSRCIEGHDSLHWRAQRLIDRSLN